MLICSANQGDGLDRAIINENKQTNDFIILVRSMVNYKCSVFYDSV